MWLVAGLGNIGASYQGNRHNVGFRALDEIFARHNFSTWQKKLHSEIAKGKIANENIVLVKPQTFMNDSGKAILAVSQFFKIQPSHIIVIHDELDLGHGRIKTKVGGGAAGHNGLRSIDSCIGKQYRRLRIGIERPDDNAKILDYVLGDFSPSDEKWLQPLLAKIAEHINLLLVEKNANDVGSLFIKKLETQHGI